MMAVPLDSSRIQVIANGADEVEMDSNITFDTSGDKPVLLIDGQPADHPVYFTEPGFNPDGKDHFQFRSDGEGGTYVNIEDLPDLGDADFGDVVLHTNFEMSDKTFTGTAVDGIIEGLEYNTTSGLHGFTDSNGDFSYKSGDSVTFNVGGVTLGVATPEDLSTGTTFLQDIADVERTNLNDEYLENMATFLQSLDENSDAYDGIVITDEIREQLADADLDLTTASEEDVQQLVEGLGKEYVSEDAAMEHVEDMLVEHTDLDHAEFEEHIDDTAETAQQRENGLTATAAEGFEAAESATDMEQVNMDTIADISLSVPSLDLPDTTDESVLASEEIDPEQGQQEADVQPAVTVQENELETAQDVSLGSLGEAYLADSLPGSSLSSLFDEPGIESEDAQTATSNDSPAESAQPQALSGATEGESSQGVEETPVGTPDETMAQDQLSADETGVDEANVSTSAEYELSTDDLHITLDDESSADSESAAISEDADAGLERFAATSETGQEENSTSSLDAYSANSGPGDVHEIASVEELETSEDNSDDAPSEDAGLNDADAIQEDLSQEPEQVDTNGIG